MMNRAIQITLLAAAALRLVPLVQPGQENPKESLRRLRASLKCQKMNFYGKAILREPRSVKKQFPNSRFFSDWSGEWKNCHRRAVLWLHVGTVLLVVSTAIIGIGSSMAVH